MDKEVGEVILENNDYYENPTLRRAFMLLEDGEWDKAHTYFERVLDENPECAEAYMGELLVELRLRVRTELPRAERPFDDSNAYRRALKYASPELADFLRSASLCAMERYEHKLNGYYIEGEETDEEIDGVDALDDAVDADVDDLSIEDAETVAEAGAISSADEASGKITDAPLALKDKIIALFRKPLKRRAIVAVAAVLVLAIALPIILAVALAGGNAPAPYVPSYITFGEYPQTIKSSSVSITDTTDSRGYYLGSDGEYYAKIVSSPYSSDYTFSNGALISSGETYYFKVEPIRWRVLSKKIGEKFLLCDSILALQVFDNGGSNNYKDSDIRSWLNGDFYSTAFSAEEKSKIKTTLVDNSAASTGYDSNSYACEDTSDKVFFLSVEEVTNSSYGFSSSDSDYDETRCMKTTDYARATGAYMSTSTEYYGNGHWWLRSPNNFFPYYASYVDDVGIAVNLYNVNYGIGAVPALKIGR